MEFFVLFDCELIFEFVDDFKFKSLFVRSCVDMVIIIEVVEI